MAASHGRNADFIGNGYVLSTYLNSATFGGQRDASESTTFKSQSKTYVPGLKDTTMNAEGIYDGDIDAADDILWAALVADVSGLFSYFPQGQQTLQNRAYSVDSIESSYEINTDIGDVAQISAEFQAGTVGRFLRGNVVRSMAVAAAGGNSAEHDFGAASTTVGIGLVVHATASSSLVLKLQHATSSGGSFTDLTANTLTFTTGRGSQRLWIPAMSINRYTRVNWTGTGTFMAIIERTP